MVWSQELLEKFWDYESQFPENYFSYHFSDEILKYLKKWIVADAHVVDYGGGAGLMTEALLDAGFRVSFVDHSQTSIDEVIHKYQGRQGFLGAYHVDDSSKLEPSADAVIMIELIEHLYNEPLNLAIEKVGEILSPSGKLFLTTPNDEELEKNQIYCPQCDHIRHRWQHVRKWDSDSLRKFLVEKNFDVESIDSMHMLNNLKSLGTLGFLINRLKRFVQNMISSKAPILVAVAKKNSGYPITG